jgi:hypothetical protein
MLIMSACYAAIIFSPSQVGFWAVEWKVDCKLLSIPEVAMMILIPFEPIILVLGLLTGLIFVGFIGSSLFVR